MRKTLMLLAGVVLLAIANYQVYDKETLLADGRRVLLELAPVDPRSLMQGDYMALRFAVADEAFGRGSAPAVPRDGHIVLRLDAQGVGHFRRVDRGETLAAGEVRMRYRVRGEQVKFASNAFFFEEGSAERYAGARYGEFRVDADGDALLTDLRRAP